MSSPPSSSSPAVATMPPPQEGQPDQPQQQDQQEASPPAEHSVTAPRAKPKPEDYIFGGLLGRGAYAQVMLATKKSTNEKFAIKVVDKVFITRHKKVDMVMNERNILSMLNHSTVVRLVTTFQDKHSLYYVLTLCPNGELLADIERCGKYEPEVARFYAAEIVSCLAYLHSKNVIHRDLKPENILLDANRHLKITDFGTSKQLDTPEQLEQMTEEQQQRLRKASFVGTAEYVSPEILSDSIAGKEADLWALGCILYQMLTGTVPFQGESEYLTFKKIESRELREWPEGVDPDGCDLVEKLLQLNPSQRLGSGSSSGYSEIKSHPFFESIDWKTLHSTEPPVGKDKPLPLEPQPSIVHALPNTSSVAAVGGGDSKSSSSVTSRSSSSANSIWQEFLDKDESIIYSGLISKKRWLSVKKRQFLLTDCPRLLYVDPSAMALRGEIKFCPELKAETVNGQQFTITVPNRVYYLTGLSSSANVWVKKINEIHATYMAAQQQPQQPQDITRTTTPPPSSPSQEQ